MTITLSVRRKGIVTVTVARTDTTVLTVDQEFRALTAADVTAFTNGFPHVC